VAQLTIGCLQTARTRRDGLLQRGHLTAQQALVLPFLAQCRRALLHLDGLEGLAQHQQLV
jgi:hypothetical protein